MYPSKSILAVTVLAATIVAAGLLAWHPGADTAATGASGKLTIFHAGSLAIPLREVSRLFMAENPGVVVQLESAGSRQCARKISDLGRRCDVLASADYKVVENLLVSEHAIFNIRFARNEMVIAYTDKSKACETVTANNWYEVLLTNGVLIGRSDPDLDPCGYRTLMVLQLAETHYGVAGLAQQLRTRPTRIRPKETDLLALLEAGEIDYLFIYRSVASQHGLKMILLPDEINLKAPDKAELYKTAAVEVTGKRSSQTLVLRGEPIIYSVTIPTSVENPKAAEAWVELLLSPRGRAIMTGLGQQCLVPAIVDGYDNLPATLKPLCRP